jgi:arabinogalactan endo-1,4-beta-galactosidase
MATRTEHNYGRQHFGPNQGKMVLPATIQGQATSIRDIINVVANVPDMMGLGLIYWEPLGCRCPGPAGPKTAPCPPGEQALFTYGGRALPSNDVFKAVRLTPTSRWPSSV